MAPAPRRTGMTIEVRILIVGWLVEVGVGA